MQNVEMAVRAARAFSHVERSVHVIGWNCDDWSKQDQYAWLAGVQDTVHGKRVVDNDVDEGRDEGEDGVLTSVDSGLDVDEAVNSP